MPATLEQDVNYEDCEKEFHATPDDPAAQLNLLNLAKSHFDRKDQGNGHHLQEARRLYKLVADRGHEEARYQWARCLFHSNQSLVRAADIFKEFASRGHAGAINSLGSCYLQAKGVQHNPAEGIRLYKDAANRGYMLAYDNLILCYQKGRNGIEQDTDEAQKWSLMKSLREQLLERQKIVDANPDDPVALFNLAKSHFDMKDEGANHLQEATILYRRAAIKWHEEAAYELARCFFYSDESLDEAVNTFRRFAGQGHAGAINALGSCYHLGKGVQEDKEQAFELYYQAAEKGYIGACENLRLCYTNGWGVGNNPQKAEEWRLKKEFLEHQQKVEANPNDPDAKYQLAEDYKNGWGVGKDQQEADRLYTLAAMQGHMGARQNVKPAMIAHAIAQEMACQNTPHEYSEAIAKGFVNARLTVEELIENKALLKEKASGELSKRHGAMTPNFLELVARLTTATACAVLPKSANSGNFWSRVVPWNPAAAKAKPQNSWRQWVGNSPNENHAKRILQNSGDNVQGFS
jgi:uncharacterized protein